MEVAFDFDIQSEDDVLRLESTIRTILQCEGTVCAFLESLPYRLIRRSLLQRLHKVIGHDADMCAYSHQNISLHVKDARLVTLRTQPISTEKKYLRHFKRRLPPAGESKEVDVGYVAMCVHISECIYVCIRRHVATALYYESQCESRECYKLTY